MKEVGSVGRVCRRCMGVRISLLLFIVHSCISGSLGWAWTCFFKVVCKRMCMKWVCGYQVMCMITCVLHLYV